MQRRRVEHDAGIEHKALIKRFLFFLQTMCGVDSEVTHEVAQEVLLHLVIFINEAGLRKRICNRGHQFDRPVVVVPGHGRTVFKRQTVLDGVFHVCDSRCGYHVGDDVHDARFRIHGINLNHGSGNLFEYLIQRGLQAAAGADRHRCAGAVFRRQVDVVDVKHTAVGDVDDGITRDGIDLHRHIVGRPVNLVGRGQFAVRAFDGLQPCLADVDRVVAEHAGGVAFVIPDDGSVEMTAFDVDGRVFKPSFVNRKFRVGGLGKRHAVGVREVTNVELAAARTKVALALGRDLVDRGIARRHQSTVDGCAARNGSDRIRPFDRELAVGSDIKTGIDRQVAVAARHIVTERNIKFAAVDRDRARVDVAALERGTVAERHFIAVVETCDICRTARCDRAGVHKRTAVLTERQVTRGDRSAVGTGICRDVTRNQTGIVDLRADDVALFNRPVCTHGDRRSFGTERPGTRYMTLRNGHIVKDNRAAVGNAGIRSGSHFNLQVVARNDSVCRNRKQAALYQQVGK